MLIATEQGQNKHFVNLIGKYVGGAVLFATLSMNWPKNNTILYKLTLLVQCREENQMVYTTQSLKFSLFSEHMFKKSLSFEVEPQLESNEILRQSNFETFDCVQKTLNWCIGHPRGP